MVNLQYDRSLDPQLNLRDAFGIKDNYDPNQEIPVRIPIYNRAVNFINLVDEMFLTSKRLHRSRFSVEWGTWSRKANIELRQGIEECSQSERFLLASAFAYWVATSNLLESHFTHPVSKKRKKKDLRHDRMEIKKVIESYKPVLVRQ